MQRLVKIEEMVGPERQEEEPKGEIIVGLSGEALKPPDTGSSPLFREIHLSNKKPFEH